MLQHVIDILSIADLYFLVSLGMLIILSVMNVINLAHGSFLMVGAYAAVVTTKLGWNPWFAIGIAIIAGSVVGYLTEVIIIRRLYKRPLDTILATWGLAILLVQVASFVFGRAAQFVDGVVGTNGLSVHGAYVGPDNILALVSAVLIGTIIAVVLRYTNAGSIARAVIMNPALAATLGIDVRRTNLITFIIGSALAALAGVLVVPTMSADPNMGDQWLIITFMVALAAGPSLLGLVISAVVLGSAQVLASYYWSPVAGSILILIIPMLVLRFLPNGFASLFK